MPSLRLRLPLTPYLRPATRTLTTSTPRWIPAKQSQDKDSLNPISTEHSKSGGDDQAAHEEGAFDPSTTRPEESRAKTESGPGGEKDSALNVSPGNPEVSKPRDPQEGGVQESPSQKEGGKKSSGAGSGKKDGGGKSG